MYVLKRLHCKHFTFCFTETGMKEKRIENTNGYELQNDRIESLRCPRELVGVWRGRQFSQLSARDDGWIELGVEGEAIGGIRVRDGKGYTNHLANGCFQFRLAG